MITIEQNTSAIRAFVEQVVRLSEPEWALFEQVLTRQTLRRKEHFLQPGQRARSVAFIETGLIRHYYLKDGNAHSVHFYQEGSMFTDMHSLLTGRPSRYYFDVLEDSRLLLIAQDDLNWLYAQSPVWDRFGRLMMQRQVMVVQEMKNALVFDSPEERYQQLVRQKPRLLERVPQHMIASYLGITPVHLSRIRRHLMEQGL